MLTNWHSRQLDIVSPHYVSCQAADTSQHFELIEISAKQARLQLCVAGLLLERHVDLEYRSLDQFEICLHILPGFRRQALELHFEFGDQRITSVLETRSEAVAIAESSLFEDQLGCHLYDRLRVVFNRDIGNPG